MRRLPRTARRRNAIASGAFAVLTAVATTGATRRSPRPFDLTLAPFDLYGFRIAGGQVQFARGQHLVLRYDRPAPESRPGVLVPSVERIAWSDPEPVGAGVASLGTLRFDQFRVAMSSWPPLTQTASVLVGGEVAVPTVASDGRATIEYREFGHRVDFRAMSAWPIVALLAGLAAWFARRAWRATIRPGECVSCGYDLRASPERCPECGRVAPPLAEG